MPSLSVVIPSRDTRELTLACLDSLPPAIDGAPLEVIVVDDAGSDDTAEAVAARHPEAEVLRAPQPLGFTRAANLGLSRAAGEIVLLLNSDTEVDAAALPALLAAFAADSRLGAAGAALRYPDGRPQWSGGPAPTLPWLFALASGLPRLLGRLPLYRRLRPPAGSPASRPLEVDWVTGAALSVRRAALRDTGVFDERFRFYGQDLDLCLRLRAAGWRVAVIPGFRILHHHGATIGSVVGSEGSGGAGAGGQHPELLWTDLLAWAAKHKSARWTARARRALLAGARLRLLGRRIASPFLPASRRELWRRQTAIFQRAVAAIQAVALPPSLPQG
ncbi:MAG TPA: glycosyltransferase family 2 protein [Thermoanaerobaculia bacterium]|nr:glycosyltransferase family 2 protein [Thermoanaerobaculia bacterium]